MPTIKARPGNWFDVYEQMFWLWLNPKAPRVPKQMTRDVQGHFLFAAQKELGPDKIKMGEKEIKAIYEANPNGVTLPAGLATMKDGLIAGLILYSVVRLSIYDEQRASVENAVRLVAFHAAKGGLPSSRAALLKAWGTYKPLSHFFAAIVHNFKGFIAIYKLMNLPISKKQIAAMDNVIPLTAKNLKPWMRDLEKLSENMKKIATEKLPEFFAVAERFRELGEMHYAPGQKVRGQAVLDSKIMWNIPRGFKFPPVKVSFKRLTKAEKTVLSAKQSLKAA